MTMADVSSGPDGSMLAQILIKQTEMGTQLAVISTKLDSLAQDAGDHEGRIRALERFRYTIAGASLFGGALAGFLGYWTGHLIH